MKAQGVDIARLAGGLAAALTGGDVDTGADAGGNAAANNSYTATLGGAGCAVGSLGAGLGCVPGAGAGAAMGLVIDGAIIILGVAGLIYLSESAGGDEQPDEAADQNGNSGDRVTNPSKAESPVWKGLDSAGNGRKKSGSGSRTRYYEWDHTHGDIEVYDNKGRHLGSADPTTGELYKPPVRGRRINL